MRLLFTGSSRHASKSASNLLSSSLNRSSNVNGRRQSSSSAGYSAVRQTTSSVSSTRSPMSVMSSTPKSSAGGLRTPRSALRTVTDKQQVPKSQPRSTSLHGPRLNNAAAKSGATAKNGLTLAVREPNTSLPSSPQSSDPGSFDEAGKHV